MNSGWVGRTYVGSMKKMMWENERMVNLRTCDVARSKSPAGSLETAMTRQSEQGRRLAGRDSPRTTQREGTVIG